MTKSLRRTHIISWPRMGERRAGEPLVKRITSNMTLSGWPGKLICIFAVALVARSIFVLTLQDGFYFPDSVDYSAAAMALITKGEFGEFYRRSPAYPVFLAGIYALFGQTIVAVRMVEALLGACLSVVIAVISKRIAGVQVGALAGLLWSFYPIGIFLAGLMYPTGVATLLLACAVLCIVTKADQELAPRRAVCGGILFGLAALTVPVALATIIASTFWITYWHRARRLLLTSLFLLGAALPVAIWTVRNFDVYGRFVLIEPQMAEKIPPLVQAQRDHGGYKSGDRLNGILDNPGAFARRFIREFCYFWELYPHRLFMNSPNSRENMHEKDARVVRETVFGTSWTTLISVLSVGPVFFFALIGTAAMGFQKDRRPHLSLLCGTILSFAVAYSFFYGKMRYRVPVEPYIIMLSAYGLRSVWLVLARRFVPKALPMRKQAEL
jgi:4-amino-4-deoxy-L-arabinose transferase-like glycosyltransferase